MGALGCFAMWCQVPFGVLKVRWQLLVLLGWRRSEAAVWYAGCWQGLLNDAGRVLGAGERAGQGAVACAGQSVFSGAQGAVGVAGGFCLAECLFGGFGCWSGDCCNLPCYLGSMLVYVFLVLFFVFPPPGGKGGRKADLLPFVKITRVLFGIFAWDVDPKGHHFHGSSISKLLPFASDLAWMMEIPLGKDWQTTGVFGSVRVFNITLANVDVSVLSSVKTGYMGVACTKWETRAGLRCGPLSAPGLELWLRPF